MLNLSLTSSCLFSALFLHKWACSAHLSQKTSKRFPKLIEEAIEKDSHAQGVVLVDTHKICNNFQG